MIRALPFALLVALSHASAETIYTRQHDVLAEAIKTGHAQGAMTGAVADLFTKQFKSSGPLLVTADVIEALPRDDCKRLRMVYTKQDVIGPKGPQEVSMTIHLTYCLDGRPPT